VPDNRPADPAYPWERGAAEDGHLSARLLVRPTLPFPALRDVVRRSGPAKEAAATPSGGPPGRTGRVH